MDAKYIERNIADCETKIESLRARVSNIKKSGETVFELKVGLSGYVDKLKQLKKLTAKD